MRRVHHWAGMGQVEIGTHKNASQKTFGQSSRPPKAISYRPNNAISFPGNTKGGSITAQLTPCLDYSVLQIKTKVASCNTADSKPVKHEVKSTVILPLLVFPVLSIYLFVRAEVSIQKLIKREQKKVKKYRQFFDIFYCVFLKFEIGLSLINNYNP
jgi:hypothetical protein